MLRRTLPERGRQLEINCLFGLYHNLRLYQRGFLFNMQIDVKEALTWLREFATKNINGLTGEELYIDYMDGKYSDDDIIDLYTHFRTVTPERFD